MNYSWVRYITLIPYVVWLMGKREGLWDWFPAFFVAMAINGLLHYLLMSYYTED